MTHTRELHGLKVRAIACEVLGYFWNNKELEWYASVGYLWYKGRSGSGVQVCKLPPGEWKVLGMANEIFGKQIWPLSGIIQFEQQSTRWWMHYCSENELTNELILIENEPH